MTKTAQQVWEEAEAGQAFITRWLDDDGDALGVVWVKGSAVPDGWVDDLDWDTLLALAPIEIGKWYL